MITYFLNILLILLISLFANLTHAHTGELAPRVIKNPYANVNWGQVQTYLANFHAHTIKSDGRAEPAKMIYMHADAGYHILALTDHDNHYAHRDGERDILQNYRHRDDNTRVPTSETTWPWTRWIDEEPSDIWVFQGWESSAFYPDLGEGGMLAIRGAELTTDPHISSLFNPCGWPNRGQQTDDERMDCVEQHGGLSYWVHPTDYVPGGRWEDRLFEGGWEEAVAYFGGYITHYRSNLGFEMQLENRLERDIELLDRMLMTYYPQHDIYIMGSNDIHSTSISENTTLTLVLAENLTEESVRFALENGHNFVGSRTDVYPQINEIRVNESTSTITVELDDYDQVRWIADGDVYGNGTSIDFSEISESVVRFEIDQGGVTFYSQGFYIR